MTLLPTFAADILHVGLQGLGMLYAVPVVAAVVTDFIMATIGNVRNQGYTILVAVAVYGLCTVIPWRINLGLDRWRCVYHSGAGDWKGCAPASSI